MTVPADRRAADADAYRRNLLLAALPTLALPIAIAVGLVGLGAELRPLAIVAGALGWIVALILRAPVAIVAFRRSGSREGAQPWITGASGPLEELVRLGVLLLVGRDLDTALSVGLGWAGIEVVYALVNGAAMLALVGRDDPEAEQARAMLPFKEALTPSAPWWGVVERAWASALHIGFTLIIAAQPILVVVTILAHSATNLALLRLADRISLARFQALGIAWAAVVVAVAAWLWSTEAG